MKYSDFVIAGYKHPEVFYSSMEKGLKELPYENLEAIYISASEKKNVSLKRLCEAFKQEHGNIKKLPKNLEIKETHDVTALVYGENRKITNDIKKAALKSGIVGFFDSKSFVICASKPYEAVIFEAMELLKSKRAKFYYKNTLTKKCLVIGY